MFYRPERDDEAERNFNDGATPTGDRFVSLLREARDALRRESGPLDIAAILHLYASTVRLHNAVRHVRNMIAEPRPQVESHGRELVRFSRDEESVFEKLFAAVRSFDRYLAELDLAVIDVYHPGLSRAIMDVVGGDIDFHHYYYNRLVPEFGLKDEALPESLRHLLQDFSGDFGYQGLGFNYLKTEVTGGRYWVENDNPGTDSTYLSTVALKQIAKFCDQLELCRSLVAAILRENWTFKEVAEISSRADLALEITMGDKFENVHNSTIINRSLVEGSFNKVARTDEQLAEALRQIATEIERTNNREAADLFDSFNEELQKTEPKKSVLSTLWSGIVAAVPTLTGIAGAVQQIVKLFT